ARSRSRGRSHRLPPPLQALQVTKKFYAPREWNCAQAFAVVLRHDYREITALARVLPILVGKTYLDAASRGDPAGTTLLPRAPGHRAGHPPSPSPLPGTDIKVNYSITNQLQEKYFNCSISVSVPAGSTLLKVLQVAQEKEPETFSFKLKLTPWGPRVISIHGLASTDDKTYWQFFSGQKTLQDGVDTYKPQDGENIKAVFSSS
ncbi:IF factor, partial [Baryphthengus martii]|nr:IF factor [Baryphthengus martii]